MKALKSFLLSGAMLLSACVFTGCTQEEDFYQTSLSKSRKVTLQDELRSNSWTSVSQDFKDRYYVAYRSAKGLDKYHRENFFMSVGFFAAVNAVTGYSYSVEATESLQEFASQNPNYSWFESYDNLRHFRNDIRSFVETYQKPVVIYAWTDQSWTKKNINQTILTVWAVSDSKVRVTRVSDVPSTKFGNNYIIELDWDSLFEKALRVSNYGVANVVYMHDGNPF